MKKNLLTMPVSLFFHKVADFPWNMLGDSINNNNLSCNPAVLKKICPRPVALNSGHYEPPPKWIKKKKKQKQLISFQKLLILSKYMFSMSFESFSVLRDVFVKKGSFPAKTAMWHNVGERLLLLRIMWGMSLQLKLLASFRRNATAVQRPQSWKWNKTI